MLGSLVSLKSGVQQVLSVGRVTWAAWTVSDELVLVAFVAVDVLGQLVYLLEGSADCV